MILETLDETWAIVEIAAGISARSLEWADHRIPYIETDLPEMLETKQTIFNEISMKKGIHDNPNHAFMPLNALNWEEWDQLGQKYFADHSFKIAVINEGLLGYLSRDEKAQLRDNIKTFFTSYAVDGMWISPDFVNSNKRNKNWIERQIQKGTERKTERKFDRFDNREEIREFLEQGGFQVDFPDNEAVLDKLTCIPKMHLKLEQIRPHLALHQSCLAKLI